MAADTLDHVNIRSDHYEESVRFYTEMLGLIARQPPGVTDMSFATWICDSQGRPVIHLNRKTDGADFLGDVSSADTASGTGSVHHVAFRCSDYDAMRALLERNGCELRFNDVPEVNLRQIFVRDPNAVLVELNFM